VRSTDQGKTWKPDGIVCDLRKDHFTTAGPNYGITADGLIILVVQRRAFNDAGKIIDKSLGDPAEGILGSV